MSEDKDIFKKKCLIITDRPIRWNKSIEHVFTLNDMLNGIDNKMNDNKKKRQNLFFKKIENIEKNKDKIKMAKTEIERQLLKLNLMLTKILEIENKRKQIKNTPPKSELLSIQAKIEKLKEEDLKLDEQNYTFENEIYELEENASKSGIDISKLQNNGENKKYKKIKFNIVIIDDTITNTDLEIFYNDFNKFDLFKELKGKYMKKYSILIKPINLHHDKRKWYKKGTFRFEKESMYDILSFNMYVDMKTLINGNEGIVEFKNEVLGNNREAALEEKLRLAREEEYNAKHQNQLEIKIEKIFSVKDFTDFIENRTIFTRFLLEKIIDKNIKEKIKETDAHEYSKNILLNIDKKYENNMFPYNEKNPLSIYYIVFLHNHLKLDPLFEKFETKIVNTIGDFGEDPKMKGIIIQSVMFKAIPNYDPVQLFKIHNDDNYYIWMKAETDKQNGLQIYESHMKKLDMLKNNLHKPIDATKLEKGGSNRRTFKKIPRHSKNKTFSYRK